jgi:teichuronic acid biosynthesis glycosyltransferase TuaC
LLHYLSCRRVLRKLLAQGGTFDLIHAHTIMPDGFGAVLLGREFNLPVVCTVHGSDITVYPQENRAVAWATTWALRRVARLITVSEDLKRKVIAMVGPRDVLVAHNGADPAIFKPASKRDARLALGLPADKKILCNIGYLRADNGPEFLLKAFARLELRDTLLCLVGDGPLREAVISQAQRLGISDFCIFAKAQPHERIPLWLAAADGLVLCSLAAGLPTILPEAMLCRVPVIATAVGGIPEIVRAGKTGLLVPCKDSEALAHAMSDLLSNSRCAAEMADRAYVFAIDALTWNANARKTIAVYESVLRTSGGSRTGAAASLVHAK